MSPEFETNRQTAKTENFDPSQVSIPAPYPLNNADSQIQNGMDAFTEISNEPASPAETGTNEV